MGAKFIKSLKNLRRTDKLETYDNTIPEQGANEIIEKVEVEEVNETVTEIVFYLPHRPVIRESAETTKKGLCTMSQLKHVKPLVA